MSRASRKAVNATTDWAITLLLITVVGFPVIYAFLGAFSPGSNIASAIGRMFTTGPSLSNFESALDRAPLATQLLNSAIVTLAQTAFQVASAILAAFALVFGNLKRPGLWLGIIIVTMMIPAETTLIANYLLVQSLGLYDTLIAVFLPYLANATLIFLLRQSMLSFPREIHEAVSIDGASALRFLWQFVIPLTRPAIASAAVIGAIAAWNGFIWPLLITESPESRTVQAGMAQLVDSTGGDPGALLAGSVLVSLPMILFVIIGQSALTKGLTSGAIR